MSTSTDLGGDEHGGAAGRRHRRPHPQRPIGFIILGLLAEALAAAVFVLAAIVV